jgi:hypothetical protein
MATITSLQVTTIPYEALNRQILEDNYMRSIVQEHVRRFQPVVRYIVIASLEVESLQLEAESM